MSSNRLVFVYVFIYTQYIYIFYFINFAKRAELHHKSIPCGRNRSIRREPTTFGRALTIVFSHEDWFRVCLTGDRSRNLRSERRVILPLHHRLVYLRVQYTMHVCLPASTVTKNKHFRHIKS